MILGRGAATLRALNKAGIRTFADLLRLGTDAILIGPVFGSNWATGLWHLAEAHQTTVRVFRARTDEIHCNETTFNEDTSDPELLDGHLWRMAQKREWRTAQKAKELAGRVCCFSS